VVIPAAGALAASAVAVAAVASTAVAVAAVASTAAVAAAMAAAAVADTGKSFNLNQKGPSASAGGPFLFVGFLSRFI
jgi:hypothetical protein